MSLEDFRQSLTATEPPAGFTHALARLWWDAKGDWTRAHESVQRIEGSWVHAYLHRKEGDQDNAEYWYRSGIASLPGATGCGMGQNSVRLAGLVRVILARINLRSVARGRSLVSTLDTSPP
jgi:hypothetical protein